MSEKNIHQRNVSGHNIVVSGSGHIVVGGNLHTQRIQTADGSDETNIVQESITGNNIVSSGDNLIIGDDASNPSPTKPESDA